MGLGVFCLRSLRLVGVVVFLAMVSCVVGSEESRGQRVSMVFSSGFCCLGASLV